MNPPKVYAANYNEQVTLLQGIELLRKQILYFVFKKVPNQSLKIKQMSGAVTSHQTNEMN